MPNQMLYGFSTLKDAANRRVEEVGVEMVTDAIHQTLAEHNRQVEALFELFVSKTTGFKRVYLSSKATRLQPLDEQGRARPIRVAGKYDIALPIQKGGLAWGATREARAKMTVQQANDTLASLLMADNRWIRDHVLAALFASTMWQWKDDEHGTLDVYGLANGDATIYQTQAGADSGSTDNHYGAQAAAIADASDPYDAIYANLAEHPENDGGVYISLIPTGLKSATQALAGFHKASDPNILAGANSDVLVGSLGVNIPGEVIGYHDSGMWIVEWKSLPAGYMVNVATGGEKPINMREHPEESLQGYKAVATREDPPFWEQHYERIAGFGAWNRVGASVYRVGNGSYAVPAGFTSPMA